ncbi:thyrostimulin alpha-2 subunit-like [Clytia hemisphaerica]|uniref:Putative cnidarian restricted protein n=1 Tax=Clytia hemisphaerica TaxID=252671 RepID=A0A069DMU7_9CNID
MVVHKMLPKNWKLLEHLSIVFILLFLLMDISWCRPTRDFLFGEENCKLNIVTVPIRLPNCQPTVVKVLGCAGYCKSDTTIDLHSEHGIIPKCNCCTPTKDITVFTKVLCQNPDTQEDEMRSVKLLSATECACSPCIRNSRHKNA